MNDGLQPLTPREMGLEHDEWRPEQFETVKFIVDSDKPLAIVQAPTGSGKSAVGMTLGSEALDTSVMVLTETRALQDQYRSYGAEVLYGLARYPCALIEFINADGCVHLDNMRKCKVATSCAYLNQKAAVLAARKRVLSYAYYLVAGWPKEEPTNWLYLDEAHNLPEIIMNRMTLKIGSKACNRYEIDPPPTLGSLPAPARKSVVMQWLQRSRSIVAKRVEWLAEQMKHNKTLVPTFTRFKSMSNTLDTITYQLDKFPDSFYLTTNEDGELEIYPLTARFGFKRTFMRSSIPQNLILTSATIGDVRAYAKALSLDDYIFRDVPSAFAPKQMPIFVPKNAPKMHYKNTDREKDKQAEIIYDMIQGFDSSWSGLIHCRSKKQTYALADRLARLGLGDRIWVPDEELDTQQRIQYWQIEKETKGNPICVSWSMWEGYDGWNTEFTIVAKIPFSFLDEVGQARREYDKNYFSWRAAVMVEQACGRVRRGDLHRDYEEDSKPMKKFVAIVDDNHKKIKRFFSRHFRSCLTEF